MRCDLCAPPTWHARKHTHTLLHACPWFALIRTVSTFAPQPISFGVVVHEIYSDGDTPYGSWTLKQVISRVNKGQRLQKPEGMPITIYLLLQTCWAPLPQDRPSFSEIYAKLDATSTKQRKADTVVARCSAQSEMEVELEDDILAPFAEASAPALPDESGEMRAAKVEEARARIRSKKGELERGIASVRETKKQ